MFLALVLVVGACGGSGGSDDEPEDGGETSTDETTSESTETTAAVGERAFLTVDPIVGLVMIDPDSGVVNEVASLETPPNVSTLAIGAGSVWIARDDGSILRVSANSGELEAEIATGSSEPIIGLSFSETGVWALHGIPGVATAVSVTDPATNTVLHLVNAPEGSTFYDIASDDTVGWVIGATPERVTFLFGISPVTGDIAEFDTSVSGNDVATGGGAVWIAGTGFTDDGQALEGVGRFGPSSGVTDFFPGGLDASQVVFDGGSVWVSDPLGDGGAFVHRLDAASGELLVSIQVGEAYAGNLPVYAGAGFIWAQTDSDITVIDPSNNEIAGLGDSPGRFPILFP